MCTNPHVCMGACSVVSDSATPWTVTHQAPLSMEFSRQEHWSGLLPFPPPRDLPNPGITPVSLCLLRWQVDSLPPAPPVLIHTYTHVYIDKMKTLEFILALSGSNMIPLCLFKSFFFPNLYILFLTLRNPTSHCLQSIHFLVQG